MKIYITLLSLMVTVDNNWMMGKNSFLKGFWHCQTTFLLKFILRILMKRENSLFFIILFTFWNISVDFRYALKTFNGRHLIHFVSTFFSNCFDWNFIIFFYLKQFLLFLISKIQILYKNLSQNAPFLSNLIHNAIIIPVI